MRPLHIWILFLVCLSVLVGAMAWVTSHALRLEQSREQSAYEADRQERIRLAVYRLDFAASGLVITENARPPQDYMAFHAAESVYNRNYQAVRKGEVLVPSPLLSESPTYGLLHFQIDAAGQLTSPQAPVGNARDLTEQNWNDQGIIQRFEGRLEQLRQILSQPAARDVIHRIPEKDLALVRQAFSSNALFAKGLELNNGAVLWSVAKPAMTEQSGQAMAKDAASKGQEEKQQFPDQFAPPAQQRMATDNEAAFRQANSTAQMQASLPRALKQKAEVPAKEERPKLNDVEKATQASTLSEIPSHATPSAKRDEVQPLQGFWLNEALFLTREAVVEGTRLVQGIWVDWPQLRTQWIEQIRDLFPNAQLVPALDQETGGFAGGPLRLASLPVRLEPGNLARVDGPFWTPVRSSLAVAWGCTLIAGLAAALVLHFTVALSERRASFVSAVTHELRTPLTTFRLYSEMLADEMVPEASTRREYLGTLNSEATRLGHLVENVLSYARLERGSARRQLETLPIRQVISRMEPRLMQRASAAGMLVDVCISADAQAVDMRTDLAALEQVLFNLVDNSCKYAGPVALDPAIHLEAALVGKRVEFRVRDHGRGIPANEASRIFRPFHKSAAEAAHSAPGVGLGLALCRRLCSQLGGNLRYEALAGQGACFVVNLPLAT